MYIHICLYKAEIPVDDLDNIMTMVGIIVIIILMRLMIVLINNAANRQ